MVISSLISNGVRGHVVRASMNHIVIGNVVPSRMNFFGSIVSGGALHNLVSGMVGTINVTRTYTFLSNVGGLNCHVTCITNLSFGLNSVVVPPRGRRVIRHNHGRIRRVAGGCGVNFVAGGRHCGRMVST